MCERHCRELLVAAVAGGNAELATACHAAMRSAAASATVAAAAAAASAAAGPNPSGRGAAKGVTGDTAGATLLRQRWPAATVESHFALASALASALRVSDAVAVVEGMRRKGAARGEVGVLSRLALRTSLLRH